MADPIRSPLRDDALQGKRILVTGGGTGLGKELARSFAAHGAKVTICGRREAVLQQAVDELQATAAHGGGVAYRICDVRSAEQVDAMVADIWQHGPLTGQSLAAGDPPRERRW